MAAVAVASDRPWHLSLGVVVPEAPSGAFDSRRVETKENGAFWDDGLSSGDEWNRNMTPTTTSGGGEDWDDEETERFGGENRKCGAGASEMPQQQEPEAGIATARKVTVYNDLGRSISASKFKHLVSGKWKKVKKWPSSSKKKFGSIQSKFKAVETANATWTELLLNLVGTFFFIVGSFGWVGNMVMMGSLIFAGACVFCGISNTLASYRNLKSGDHVRCYAYGLLSFGCYTFSISSIAFIIPNADLNLLALLGFLAASLSFLFAYLDVHVVCWTLLGLHGPLWPLKPNTRRFSPFYPLALNTSASIMFTLGSVLMFWSKHGLQGAWWYGIGSVAFMGASWGDITIAVRLKSTYDPREKCGLQESDCVAAVRDLQPTS